jgi:hypothetical protein
MVPQQEAATCTFAPDPAVGCVDASECPAPPATGTAVVTCGDMDFDPTHDECYLDCSGGQTCPDGQACFNGQVCAFPTVTTVGPHEACNGEDVICAAGSICFSDTFPATLGVCMQLGCPSVAACPAGPAGSTVVCGEVSPVLLGNECYLECTVDPDCPAGMQCFLDQLCVWPL